MIYLFQVSPQIITPPISRYVTEGDRVDLICIASGFPKPTLVWTFNNGNLPSGINQFNREGESNLVLPSVTKEMNGTYKCTAKNKANTAAHSAVLRVYGKLRINDIVDDDDDDDNDDDDVDNDDDDYDDDDDDDVDNDDDDDDDDDNEDDDDEDDDDVIHQIEFYPMDSVIHPSNNGDMTLKKKRMISILNTKN